MGWFRCVKWFSQRGFLIHFFLCCTLSGYVGCPGVWVNNDYSLRVVAHEFGWFHSLTLSHSDVLVPRRPPMIIFDLCFSSSWCSSCSGHNFGLHHSHDYVPPTTGFVDPLAANGTLIDYGDSYDMMASCKPKCSSFSLLDPVHSFVYGFPFASWHHISIPFWCISEGHTDVSSTQQCAHHEYIHHGSGDENLSIWRFCRVGKNDAMLLSLSPFLDGHHFLLSSHLPTLIIHSHWKCRLPVKFRSAMFQIFRQSLMVWGSFGSLLAIFGWQILSLLTVLPLYLRIIVEFSSTHHNQSATHRVQTKHQPCSTCIQRRALLLTPSWKKASPLIIVLVCRCDGSFCCFFCRQYWEVDWNLKLFTKRNILTHPEGDRDWCTVLHVVHPGPFLVIQFL